MLANLIASLIIHKRVKTTLAKAKAARPLAEKLVTLGKGGTLHDRRLAVAKIGQKEVVSKLFKEVAPGFKDRKGGYTRIIKLGPRQSDSASACGRAEPAARGVPVALPGSCSGPASGGASEASPSLSSGRCSRRPAPAPWPSGLSSGICSLAPVWRGSSSGTASSSR